MNPPVYYCEEYGLKSMAVPKFTVIVATCGRPDRLADVLEHIRHADELAGGGNLLIVADNHPDHTAERTVQAFAAGSGLATTYLQTPSRDKCKALNAAIQAAQTEWLAFTDDDTEPDGLWLKAAGLFARGTSVRVFGGQVVPGSLPDRIPRTLGTPSAGQPYPGGGVFVRYQPQECSGLLDASRPAPIGANVFIRRDLFEDVGCYDEALWKLCGRAALGVDDGEFGVRLKRLGEPIGYCREALVVHPIHTEKMALRQRMIHWYRFGWRDPIVFHDELPDTFARHSAKGALQHAWLAMSALAHGNLAEFGDELVRAVRRYGMMRGRLSSAFRRR